ncbi:hypothetical protein NFI96_031897, partial [Prochilodus magdalenae]
MAPGFGWISGSASSLEITIASILFVVVYITLCNLCIWCFRQSPAKTTHHPEEKEIPSSIVVKEKLDDQWSTNRTSGNEHASNSEPKSSAPPVPPRPHTRSHTMVQGQQPKVLSHNRGLVVSEEDPYETIGMVNVSEPSPPSSSNEAAKDQSENESLYQIIREPGEPTAGHLSTSLTVLENEQTEKLEKLSHPLPAEQDDQCLTGTESAPIYAAVNWKSKSMKLAEFPFSSDAAALDEDDGTEEAAPPIEVQLSHPPPAEQDDQCLTGTESVPIYTAVNWKSKSMKLAEFPFSPAAVSLDEDDGAEE